MPKPWEGQSLGGEGERGSLGVWSCKTTLAPLLSFMHGPTPLLLWGCGYWRARVVSMGLCGAAELSMELGGSVGLGFGLALGQCARDHVWGSPAPHLRQSPQQALCGPCPRRLTVQGWG